MEKLSVSKEFVLAAHNAACSEWRSKIKEQFPGLFEAEKGKWYFNNDSHLINFSQYGNGNYGISCMRDWHENMRFSERDSIRLATKEEIEKHLSILADKKGLKEGGNCFWADTNITHRNLKGQPKYNPDIDCLSFQGCIVYHDGKKWGQAISEPVIVEITMDEIAKLKGCDVSQLKIKK